MNETIERPAGYLLLGILLWVIVSTCSHAQAPSRDSFAERLAKMDKDGDGRLARGETSGLMSRFFERNDSDKNGYLDAEELRQLAQRMATRNRAENDQASLSDAKIRSQVPQGVEANLNLAYREGDPAWQLDLFTPKTASSSPRPAIVFVHGGGWRGGDKRAANFLGPAIQYANKGYVTVTVNYRLDRAILPCVHDVKCAVRWLRAHAKEYNVDPERIGAYGNSAGAHLVVMLGLSHTEPELEGDGPWQEFSSAVQSVVASATPTLPVFGSGSEQVRIKVAPMTYVSKNAPPMLLFHDQADKTVAVENGDEFVEALRTAGAHDITYKRYANNSGHGVFSRNQKETAPMMEAFFARTLKHESGE